MVRWCKITMLSYKEREKLEQEFQYALDNIVSKIKGETATAIVVSEQSMILLFKKLMLKIEKQSKEIEELKDKNKSIVYNYEMVVDKLEKSTPNDKIKAKIEEVKDGTFDAKIVLQSLLEKE